MRSLEAHLPGEELGIDEMRYHEMKISCCVYTRWEILALPTHWLDFKQSQVKTVFNLLHIGILSGGAPSDKHCDTDCCHSGQLVQSGPESIEFALSFKLNVK
jgi:hypothetical protein